jgi:hypothetical protein
VREELIYGIAVRKVGKLIPSLEVGLVKPVVISAPVDGS